MLFAECVDDAHHVFVILALRDCRASGAALRSQRLARTWHFHILITAKRGHGPVDAGQSVLRGSDGEFTLVNLQAQMSGVVQQGLLINLSRVVKARPILRPTPPYKCLPPITVRFDRAVMAAAKKITQCL
ncbi:hypothetical protein D3C75_976090 [compost metagenome]